MLADTLLVGIAWYTFSVCKRNGVGSALTGLQKAILKYQPEREKVCKNFWDSERCMFGNNRSQRPAVTWGGGLHFMLIILTLFHNKWALSSGYQLFFHLAVKWPGCEADHFPPSSVKVTNDASCNSAHPSACIVHAGTLPSLPREPCVYKLFILWL